MFYVTYNNIAEAERLGCVNLYAFSRVTGETEPVSTAALRLFKLVPDMALTDSKGNPMVIAMSTAEVVVTAIVDEVVNIIDDYLALDRLERRGYFA